MIYLSHLKGLLTACFTLLIFCTVAAQETNCNNGIDDDGDGFIDCGDTECAGIASCSTAFTCENTLYQVISASLKKLDPLTGTYKLVGTATSSYNGAGYNVQDGFIYGIRSGSNGKSLWKIDNTGAESNIGTISGFKGRTYVGDFDEKGNLYTYENGSKPKLHFIDVNNLPIRQQQVELKNLSGMSIAGVADITYNPVFQRFYGLSGGLDLIELDHVNRTANKIADFTGQVSMSGGFGAAYSDVDGNSYFSNNSSGKIVMITFNDDGTPATIEHVATGQPTNSNDGMGCFLSLPPFETDCSDGIDNDGDGLIDCLDPDCVKADFCPTIDLQLYSVNEAGPNGLVPFHIMMVNNSKSAAKDFSVKFSLPEYFSYNSDTILLTGSSAFTTFDKPVSGETSGLKWTDFSIPPSDSIIISFSVYVDPSVPEDSYKFKVQTDGVISNPNQIEHELQILESLYYSPEAYSCEPAFYQVYQKRNEPNILGKLDVTSGEYQQLNVIDAQLNGLGFDQLSGYVYGSHGNKFIRMDEQGNASYMNIEFEKNVYVGDMDEEGNWYGKDNGDIIKINVESNTVVDRFEKQGMPGWDMAYNQDGNFYAVHKNDMYKFDTSSKKYSKHGSIVNAILPQSGHGAQWTGKDGYHYISNNATGGIYKIDVLTLEAVLVLKSTPGLKFNDGFSCPSEIPVVYNLDYGDYNAFPIASQFVNAQDIDEDGIPDFDMVWIGDRVIADPFIQTNGSATVEKDDSEVVFTDAIKASTKNSLSFDINTNAEKKEAYWGVWIDWNEDGNYEDYFSGTEIFSGKTTISIPVSIPSAIQNKIGIRIRVGGKPFAENQFAGNLLEPGEVEDHVFYREITEICDNQIDDDKDGLTDCDDPDCSQDCSYDNSSTSQEGGLESNNRLSHKIAQVQFNRRKNNDSRKYLNKNNLSRFSGASNANARIGKASLENFIPINAIPGTESYVNSPEHLIDITNAVDLFSVDIFEKESRVAAILALETKDAVYEHSKYICDRLSGAKLLDIFSYNSASSIDLLIAKIEQPNGMVEYTTSFSFFENKSNQYEWESYWNLNSYSKNQGFYNFQVWANNTANLITLVESVENKMRGLADITEISVGDAPEVFVKSGNIVNEQLKLQIANKIGLDYINATIQSSVSELAEPESEEIKFDLNGNALETITYKIGDVYDIGISLYHPKLKTSDVIFLADGLWGFQEGSQEDKIKSSNIINGHITSNDNYKIKRGIELSGQVKNYINIYRSLNPRFAAEDLDEFQSFHFDAYGLGKLEVAIVKEGVQDWYNQAKMIIELTEETKTYSFGKKYLEYIGHDNKWDDVYMIVFNVLGDFQSASDFKVSISNAYFGNSGNQSDYLIYTKQNILQSEAYMHEANEIDGTAMGDIAFVPNSQESVFTLYIENTGSSDLFIDDLDYIGENKDFQMLNFEPIMLNPGEKNEIDFTFQPQSSQGLTSTDFSILMSNKTREIKQHLQLSANAACSISLDISGTINSDKEYKAKDIITSSENIMGNTTVMYSANESIKLEKGFSIEGGSAIIIKPFNDCQ